MKDWLGKTFLEKASVTGIDLKLGRMLMIILDSLAVARRK